MPATHAFDAVAAPLPPAGLELLPVIASTKTASKPAPIVRVSATDGPASPGSVPTAEKPPAPTPLPARGQSASVAVEIIGADSVGLGQTFTYEIVVRNPGATPAQFVRVQDLLPDNLRYDSSEPSGQVHEGQLLWNLGTMEAGGERRIKVQVQATGDGEFSTTATATCSARTSLRTKVNKPRLSLVKKGPETAELGETVKFELTVRNLGTTPVEKVLLRDKMPAGLQHAAQRTPGEVIEADLSTLAPGQTKTIDMAAKAIEPGRFVNEAALVAPGMAEITAQAVIVVNDASLTLRKTGPQRGNPNQELDFALVVTNVGQAAATNVKLTDSLPEGLAFISATDGGTHDAKAGLVQWDLPTLAAGQSKAVSLRVKAVKSGDWTNQAVARTEHGKEARADLPVRVEGVPAMLLEVVDLDDPVELGADTTYEIRVVNQGTAACTNVKIVCDAPDGMQLLGAEGPVTHRTEGRRVTFEPLPKLAAKADVIYKVKVRAAKAGDWRFRTWLSSDHMPQPIYEDESTQVYCDEDAAPASRQEINRRQ
jgi:uncharacterized repeat protein (TIGR01451 family)